MLPKACLIMFLMPPEKQREERAPRTGQDGGREHFRGREEGCRGWASTCYPGLFHTV